MAIENQSKLYVMDHLIWCLILGLVLFCSIAPSVSNECNQELLLINFFLSYVKYYSFYRPLFITTDLNQAMQAFQVGWTTMVYRSGTEDIKNIAAKVNASHDDVDILIFAGSGHRKLLASLDFQTTEESLLDISVGHNLRYSLNSKTVFYHWVDCNRLLLSDRYSVKKGPVIEEQIGEWTDTEGLAIVEPIRWRRRSDLGGIQLIDSIFDNWSTRLRFDETAGVLKSWGFSAAFMDILKGQLNFTSVIIKPPHDLFGSPLANGTWTGIFGELATGKADYSSANLKHNLERDAVADFSKPLTLLVVTLIGPIPKVSDEIRSLVYLNMVTSISWIAAATLSALAFALLAKIQNREGMMASPVVLSQPRLMGIFFHDQVAMSGKIVILTANLASFMFFAFYTADMRAIITSPPRIIPIRSFEDLLTDNKYRVIVNRDGADVLMLANSYPGSPRRTYYDKYMANDPSALVSSDAEGVAKILNEPDTLLFGARPLAAFYKDLTVVRITDSLKIPLRLAYPKGSEFREIFDYYLDPMLRGGVIGHLERKYYPVDQYGVTATESVASLGFGNLIFPYFLIASGIVAATVTLLAELLAHHLNCRLELRT